MCVAVDDRVAFEPGEPFTGMALSPNALAVIG